MQEVIGHVHWSSQSGVVISWGLEFYVPAFVRV